MAYFIRGYEVKKNIAIFPSVILCVLLAACSPVSPGETEQANSKSDSIACKNMNADYMTGLVGNSNLGNASERVQLVADEILDASRNAESSLLVNIMEDNAESIQNIAILADEGSSNEFVLGLVADKLFAVIDACESVE